MPRTETEIPQREDEILLEGIQPKEREARRRLGLVLQKLEDTGVGYVLVGGLPLEAYLNNGEVNMVRDNSTLRDVDGLLLDKDPVKIAQVNKAIAEMSRGWKEGPSIGFDPVPVSDEPLADRFGQLLPALRQDGRGNYYLSYKGVDKQIPAETMVPVEIDINGYKCKTLPPRTIFYRYMTRTGALGVKPKDVEKIEKLWNYMEKHPEQSPEGPMYKSYVEFADEVEEKYPERAQLQKLFWKLDYGLGGPLSGSTVLYPLIKLFGQK